MAKDWGQYHIVLLPNLESLRNFLTDMTSTWYVTQDHKASNFQIHAQ
jgi:hypothetical protein